jgi:hypothetical protein
MARYCSMADSKLPAWSSISASSIRAGMNRGSAATAATSASREPAVSPRSARDWNFMNAATADRDIAG